MITSPGLARDGAVLHHPGAVSHGAGRVPGGPGAVHGAPLRHPQTLQHLTVRARPRQGQPPPQEAHRREYKLSELWPPQVTGLLELHHKIHFGI